MRRWGIAELLGIGLALLVGGTGFIVLFGLWIITQRDIALASGLEAWSKWDRTLTLWAYGSLLGLVFLAVGIALWWWRWIGRGLLGVRDQFRAVLWEERPEPETAQGIPALVEAQEIWQSVDLVSQLLQVLQEITAGKRHNLPPHSTAWPPLLRESLGRLVLQLTQGGQRRALVEDLLQRGTHILRISQLERTPQSYLAKAGPVFIQGAGAAMGAFYKLEGEKLHKLYSYAYPAAAPETFHVGEGWIGQVAREGQALWLTTLPEGYLAALSGLGRATPQALAVLPVIAGESIRGVWDLATFTEWEASQREAVETLLPFFAVGLLLVEETQREELFRASQQALQEQMQRIEAQSARMQLAIEEATRKEAHLLRQLTEAEVLTQKLNQRLSLEQQKWQILASHLSEAIVLFDAKGRPLYLSPAVSRLLGYSAQELQVFFRPVEKADAEAVREYFETVLHTKGKPLSLRFRYRHKDGHPLWIEASAQNYLDHPALQGILFTLRDVSDQIEYEKQYRTRLKFQSLVENSPDIIFRVDREGTFLYVNPTIERYTGYSPSHYIRNTIYSVGFSLDEVRFWEAFIQNVFRDLAVRAEEIDFPSVYGVRKMAVRGIPEIGPEGEVETMVVLLQDITELRQIQEQLHLKNLHLEQAKVTLEHQKRELEEKNRDIMESITYARRIQGALIPGESGLAEFFPDSFILHWLRDVVGGDFYWYGEVEGQVVVAVVDCTGHGIPGAFMTFLGYTLIESAVRERRILDPAQILGFMDTRLRELFSGQDSMQDGMDVALCVIDPERRLLRFAGAHRPLLLYQNAQWSLVSGAPTGLGGALWLDEIKAFTTHTFFYRPGDQVYLYTDGYLDQFGQGGQRRYSHRRFREFLATWAHLPMVEQHRLLIEELRSWMGDTPPTDDITVLGIRL